MWIDDEDGKWHHLINLWPEENDCAARAAELGLLTIPWKQVHIMHHKDKRVEFLMARARQMEMRNNGGLVGLEEDMQHRYPGLFESPTGVLRRCPFDMRIEVEPGAMIPYTNPYRDTAGR
jgi:hypothetical protein